MINKNGVRDFHSIPHLFYDEWIELEFITHANIARLLQCLTINFQRIHQVCAPLLSKVIGGAHLIGKGRATKIRSSRHPAG